ncbi:MAG: HAMP domain-containing sensor histidine kinase [Marinobacter sp.]|uniref:sensor histidine kinase n=1 Tax=Marinobacter sp. TaxID=50741 RepID=UPI0034A01A51
MIARFRRLAVGTRLLIAALMLVLVMLPVAGALLAYNFNQAVTTAFDERLESLLNVVLAGIDYDPVENTLVSGRALGDPRFDRVFSGWYWQVTDQNDRTLTSRSLWDQRLPTIENRAIDIRDIEGPRGQALRRIERDVQLSNLDATLHLTVAASRVELDAEVNRFRQLLWISLAVLGFLLIVGLALQVRWGLTPLRRIRGNLREVESGSIEKLDTDLPAELRELAEAINMILDRDRQLIERGRTAAGNLAHALKTPVSVLKTLSDRLPDAQRNAVVKELSRLDEAVRHHLARASAAGAVSLTTSVDVQTVMSPVLDGIGRLAERRGLKFNKGPVPSIQVRMDSQDLQEILGNVLENAVKWARSEMSMVCEVSGNQFSITITDDGKGMTESECQTALKRGGKLDEHRSGSGLGLAIVMDLVKLYGGELVLSPADGGGLAVVVRVPTVTASLAMR